MSGYLAGTVARVPEWSVWGLFKTPRRDRPLTQQPRVVWQTSPDHSQTRPLHYGVTEDRKCELFVMNNGQIAAAEHFQEPTKPSFMHEKGFARNE